MLYIEIRKAITEIIWIHLIKQHVVIAELAVE
jgi:hypothetical protein